jgi:ketosteroid isomerase-like protein
MATNSDLVRNGYDAFARGDLDGAVANFDDDIRWENPEAPQLPNPGVTKGREEVKRLLAEVATFWESFKIEPDEFIEQGDTVVVLSHAEGTARDTGKDVKLPFVHVWKLKDGKAKEVLALTDTALAADALGRL